MSWTERSNVDGWLVVHQSDDGRWQIEPREDFHVENEWLLVDLKYYKDPVGPMGVRVSKSIEELKKYAEAQ